MVGKTRELVVALCDPKLMEEFKALAKLLDLSYSVPRLKKSFSGRKLIIADDECIKLYGLKGSNMLPVNESNLTQVMFNLSGRTADVLLVGVDPGRRFAYVIISGDVVYLKGYVANFSELLRTMESVVRKLKPRKVVIKVGERSRGKVLRMLSLSSNGPYELYVVSESKTNSRNLYLVSEQGARLSKDFIAALNIALRRGLRINP